MINIIVSVLGFFISMLANYYIIIRFSKVFRLGIDYSTSEPQKFHTEPTPRLGGVSIFISLFICSIVLYIKKTAGDNILLIMLICFLPTLIFGLLEDFTRKVSPYIRLIGSFLSAYLVISQMAIYLPYIDIPIIDWIFRSTFLHYLFFLISVGGVINAFNIIDGYNGLLSGVTLLVFFAYCFVSYKVGEREIFILCLIIISAVLGFFFWNFPYGRIFAGDTGAYLLGFLSAVIGLLLVQKSGKVSAWFILVVLIYPVWETIFSIFRKLFITQQSPFKPDGYHFHMLVYKSLFQSETDRKSEISFDRNAKTSILLWLFSTTSIFPAVMFFDKRRWLIFFGLLFLIIYTVLYVVLLLFLKEDAESEA